MRIIYMAMPLIVSFTLLSGCGGSGIRKGDVLELKPAALKSWVEGVAHDVLLRVNLKRNSVDRADDARRRIFARDNNPDKVSRCGWIIERAFGTTILEGLLSGLKRSLSGLGRDQQSA